MQSCVHFTHSSTRFVQQSNRGTLTSRFSSHRRAWWQRTNKNINSEECDSRVSVNSVSTENQINLSPSAAAAARRRHCPHLSACGTSLSSSLSNGYEQNTIPGAQQWKQCNIYALKENSQPNFNWRCAYIHRTTKQVKPGTLEVLKQNKLNLT